MINYMLIDWVHYFRISKGSESMQWLEPTGKTRLIRYGDREILFHNQKSADWTHPYGYGEEKSDLCGAGCGIFAIAHAVEWMTGRRIDVEALADFSLQNGGRDDTGTDRPALLSAMQRAGLAREMGFEYRFDGLRNDHQALAGVLEAGGAALCNLRVGHIVCLVDIRERGGEKQVLAMDSVCESVREKLRDSVRECVPGSEIVFRVKNAAGLEVGRAVQYALFWVPLSLPMDFNLLNKL